VATLRDQAKIYVNDRLMRIDEGEPLEESVRTVHSVMLMMAERGGEPIVYRGIRGLKKHLNLTRVVTMLTVDHSENDRKVLARLISQVFRQTGAAVCLRHADPHRKLDPVWFVSYELPDSFIVVVQSVRGRSAGVSGSAPTTFNEDLFLRPRERKLLPEEVGETQPPGEVTVTQTATNSKKGRKLNLSEEQRQAAAENARRVFANSHAENQRLHDEMVEQLHEFVVTAPIAMSSPEIAVLFNREFGTDWHESTLRMALRELEDAGRISSRKETKAERLVRGGGHPVKATGPKLYGPPEGVPERTQLPRGIEPMKSAVAHAEEKKRERQSLEERVYAAMDVPRVSGTGHGAPRTPHMIAIAADISDREATEVLERLVASGRVFHHPTAMYYAPMSRVRQATLDMYRNGAPEPQAPEDLTAEEVEPAAEVRLEPAAAAPDIGALVRAEVERALAGVAPAASPQPRVTVMGETITELREENETLKTENETLKAENEALKMRTHQLEDVVRGLRQALASMELLGE
jgi:FtsZ-binding cell division protein ZapB